MAKKKLKGTIKRISGKNTIAVEVVNVYHHPRYRKRIRTSKVYLVHTEKEGLGVGEQVTIEAIRPVSARKHFQVIVVEGKPVFPEIKSELKSKEEKPARIAKKRKETKK